MSGQRSRRIGISRSPKQGLLKTVGGKPRDVYDANTPQRDSGSRTNTSLVEDSPDPISSDLAPTIFTSQPKISNRVGPIKKASVKTRSVLGLDSSSSDLDADPLTSKTAPTVTSRTRRTSRQPSTEPQSSDQNCTGSKARKLDDEEICDSAENWNNNIYMGAVFGAGSNVEDAKKSATRAKTPDRTWEHKKVRKKYGSKKLRGTMSKSMQNLQYSKVF